MSDKREIERSERGGGVRGERVLKAIRHAKLTVL